MPIKVLILGGTGEARVIAAEHVAAGNDVTTSLAGVTRDPILPEGKIRVGGFGGADGLRDFLTSEKFDLVIDATHPFATRISENARRAVEGLDVRLDVVERAPWVLPTNAVVVKTIDEAARVLPGGARVLLTTGHKGIDAFLDREDISGVIRTIEPPTINSPRWTVLLARPPFSFESEVELMKQNHITHLVTKNAGGESTVAKLQAAEALGIVMIVIQRPENISLE